MDIVKVLANELNIKTSQVEATIKLIDEGCTIPFIARYRKEVTGSLNDEILRKFDERLTYLRNLEEKKEQVLNSIINYAANELGDVIDGWVINYFEQQFADNCAGGWVNFNLEVPSVLGDCLIDEYQDDEEKLIERLKEAIRQYEEDNTELALLLKEILHKISGEVVE